MNELSERRSPAGRLPAALAKLLQRRQGLGPMAWRELTQFARDPRSGRRLFGAVTAMLLALLGTHSLHHYQAEPAKVGSALYQAFFSVTQLLVMMVVPQLAAGSILNERAQHTWETLQLSPLGPTRLAWGKFWACLGRSSTFLAATAPLGALALLFGGVTLTEFLAAYAFIVALTVLAVWLGLAIGASSKSTTTALASTLGWSLTSWLAAYFGLGWGLSPVVHHAWPEVPGPVPVWWPLALVHAPAGIHYGVALVAAPLAVWWSLVSLLHQLTLRAFTLEAERTPHGLQRWLLTTTPLVWLLLLAPRLWVSDRRLHWVVFGAAAVGVCTHGWLCQLLFCSERETRRSVRYRFLGVRQRRFGHARAQWRVLLLTLTGISMMLALGAWQASANAHWLGVSRHPAWLSLQAIGASGAAFLTFTGGLVVQLRRRGLSPPAARLSLTLSSVAILLGPWLLAGLASLLRNTSGAPKALLAAGSPSFSLLVVQRLESDHADTRSYVLALALATTGWLLLGILLWLMQPQAPAASAQRATPSPSPPPPTEGAPR